ncbi:MAG: HEAT repeat domain-containing protein, partial [Planctomycetes bacterium]|nr:HEAT repeat domain-containing protein [Planctomycetota bacterium]
EQELGSIALADLLAQLAEAERSINPEEQVAELYLKFKALCFLDPASAHDLGALLIQASVEAPRAGLFASVLGTVGHSDAQRALIAAINARADDWEALALLIPALGDAATPAPEAVAALEHLIGGTQDERIRSTAQLALGNMARSVARSSPERASRIVSAVLDDLGRTNDEPTKRTLLLVLGNCGATEALPEIRPYLESDALDLRSAAFAALRFVDGPQIDALLIGALAEDPAESVRLEALDAFAVRAPTPTTLAAIAHAGRADSAVNVRIKAVEVLWDAHPSRPEAAQILKSILEQDQSTDVKRAVRARLEGDAESASAATSRPA